MDQRLLVMHQVMLGDRVRLDAYDQALQRVIDRDSVVVDVGAGTLILSLMALRHGARHVYAIESDPQTLVIAHEIVRANKLQDRLTLVECDARNARLPARANVLVSEMMGNLGPEEEMAELIEIVARRNLRADGHIVPQRISTQLQAIEFDGEGWGVWTDDVWDFSFSCVQELAPSHPQLHFFSRAPVLLSPPTIVEEIRLGESPRNRTPLESLEIAAPGTLHAIIGYFTATLAPGIQLSNFPSYPGSNWAVWVWPVRHTLVAPGDRIRVSLKRPTNVRMVTDWRLDCSISRRRSA